MKKLIYVLAAVKFALPFLLQNAVYEPHRDEFLYLAEARHMAWGYLELPPVLSVLSFISNLFGGGLFWIKFWPSLGGALTYVLVGRMIPFDRWRALCAFIGLAAICVRLLFACAFHAATQLP